MCHYHTKSKLKVPPEIYVKTYNSQYIPYKSLSLHVESPTFLAYSSLLKLMLLLMNSSKKSESYTPISGVDQKSMLQ